MSRNTRTYDHFCLLARALERVGDRWSLLVVRDLLTGAKRFTDLLERLGGITPKTLTQRLRDLEGAGVLTADRQPGRREVWYRLTPSGAALGPAIEALSWWGLQHAWRPPRPGERLHPEHLLRAITQAIERSGQDRTPARWRLHIARAGNYLIHCNGQHWSLTSLDEPDQVSPAAQQLAEVSLTADAASFPAFVRDPSPQRAAELGIDLHGQTAALQRFTRLLGTFARSMPDRPPG